MFIFMIVHENFCLYVMLSRTSEACCSGVVYWLEMMVMTQ